MLNDRFFFPFLGSEWLLISLKSYHELAKRRKKSFGKHSKLKNFHTFILSYEQIGKLYLCLKLTFLVAARLSHMFFSLLNILQEKDHDFFFFFEVNIFFRFLSFLTVTWSSCSLSELLTLSIISTPKIMLKTISFMAPRTHEVRSLSLLDRTFASLIILNFFNRFFSP